MRWLDGVTDPMDMGLSKLQEIVKDREAWRVAVHGIPKTFVGKVLSLLFNMLSRLVITFLPRSKHLLWFSFQSQRKAMPKNAQTTAQLHSSHTLVK